MMIDQRSFMDILAVIWLAGAAFLAVVMAMIARGQAIGQIPSIKAYGTRDGQLILVDLRYVAFDTRRMLIVDIHVRGPRGVDLATPNEYEPRPSRGEVTFVSPPKERRRLRLPLDHRPEDPLGELSACFLVNRAPLNSRIDLAVTIATAGQNRRLARRDATISTAF
jgi:hypothetical protein